MGKLQFGLHRNPLGRKEPALWRDCRKQRVGTRLRPLPQQLPVKGAKRRVLQPVRGPLKLSGPLGLLPSTRTVLCIILLGCVSARL